MAEWSIAAVLKTVELRGSGGSNPSLSAEEDATKRWVTHRFFRSAARHGKNFPPARSRSGRYAPLVASPEGRVLLCRGLRGETIFIFSCRPASASHFESLSFRKPISIVKAVNFCSLLFCLRRRRIYSNDASNEKALGRADFTMNRLARTPAAAKGKTSEAMSIPKSASRQENPQQTRPAPARTPAAAKGKTSEATSIPQRCPQRPHRQTARAETRESATEQKEGFGIALNPENPFPRSGRQIIAVRPVLYTVPAAGRSRHRRSAPVPPHAAGAFPTPAARCRNERRTAP